MKNPYQNLLSTLPLAVAEPAESYFIFTERHLQALWLEQKYFKNLSSSEGKTIEVISPGIWNQEAGPDFLKAHLLVDGLPMIGDVELHLSAGDWTNHRHHEDERYNQVVLHLFLWDSKTLKDAYTQQGKRLLQAGLESCLTIPPRRIVQLIDLDLYPYRKFVGSGHCARSLFCKLPEQKILTFFEDAAGWRLQQKRGYLQHHIEDPDLQLGAGIAMALGYKQNTEVFLNLFLWLYPKKDLGEDALYALALGACGFFTRHYEDKWLASDRYGYLKALYTMLAFSAGEIPTFRMTLHSIRPLSHPVRRLAYLTKLAVDPGVGMLLKKMEACWLSFWPSENWGKTKKELERHIPSYEDPYWNSHYTFGCEETGEHLPLMGPQLKKEILVNTILPLLQAGVEQRANPREVNALKLFYQHLPASITGKTRYLIHRFFGDSLKGELMHRADIEQGGYQLHRDFCIHYEASCEGCPFVSRYQQNY